MLNSILSFTVDEVGQNTLIRNPDCANE